MHAIDVGEADFEQQVIERSHEVPVIVDFWAPWCGPCQMLKPILEKLAEEYGGRFLLAKVNSDENPRLASRFGVRGIPSVKAVVEGRIVDEFSGALPESEVRVFIERLLPSAAEKLRRQAGEQRGDGDAERARELLEEALAMEPENDRIRLDLARVYLDLDRPEAAREQIEALSPAARVDEEAKELESRLQLAEQSRDLPEEAELRRRIISDPNDLEARLQLANRYAAEHRYAEAMEQLLEIIRRDRGFKEDIGRKQMLALFKGFIKRQRAGLEVEKVATGEHWLGSRALELGLVDELLTSDDYLMAMREQADIVEVHYVFRPGLKERLFSLLSKSRSERAALGPQIF